MRKQFMFNFFKTLFDGSMKPNTDTPSNASKIEYETILGYKRKFISGDSLPAKIQRLGFVKSLLQMPTDKVFLIYGKTLNGIDVKFVTLAMYRDNPCIIYFYDVKGSAGDTSVTIIMDLDGQVLQIQNSFDTIANLQDYQLYEVTDVSFHYSDFGVVKSFIEAKKVLQKALQERLLDPAPFI